ncbi:hypothetical protein [Methylovorus glucosotrophus]|uniref:Uncharacterized protein n=1 Tax=Methylovorus glucosotrophus (strain SIP3-4) TaxID=582744 RepID=C6XEB9_METGS|nr:hypothetical protein [Methylovorus glucosotrophus]ACT50894.1 hypothetical protein Msip34_1649 [Methylovorus glucosotrophus SIP3-4]
MNNSGGVLSAFEKMAFEGLGYTDLRILPDGTLAGLAKVNYTTCLMIGLSEYGYKGRFEFQSLDEAQDSLDIWDGKGNPPGNWITYHGIGGSRVNPYFFEALKPSNDEKFDD